MVAELGHLSLSNSLEKLSPSHHNGIETQPQHHNPSSGGGSWMWNLSQHHQQQVVAQDDDSWEVRAFAEDTGNILGTTWPPRSYTCTFCRREFRSAQALGGHMNVHRRDRARLHQMHHQGTASSSSAALIIPAQDLMAAAAAGGAGGGLCVLYQLPPSHSGGVYASTAPNINAWAASPGLNHHHHRQNYDKSGEPNSSSIDYNSCKGISSSISIAADGTEELDLELRL